MRLVASMAFAASLFAVPRAEAGACAPRVMEAAPLSTRATIGADGGALIGWNLGGGGGGDAGPALDALDRWKFVSGSRALGLRSEQLAPGLWRVRPSAAGRRATLRDDRGRRQVTVTIARTLPAPLPAPKATIEVTSWSGGPHSAGGSRAVATLASVPAGAVALVVFPGDDDDHAPAISWGRVGGATQVEIATSGGRCSPVPAGMRTPGVGESVRLAWLDQYGRLSAESAPITTTAPPGAPGLPTVPTP